MIPLSNSETVDELITLGTAIKSRRNKAQLVAVSIVKSDNTDPAAEKISERLLEKAVKTGKAFTVIVADDSSDNTKKMFTNMCTYYKVPIHFFSDKVSVGHAIGKEFRASLAVLDEGFAKTIEKYFEQGLE